MKWFSNKNTEDSPSSAAQLCKELPTLKHHHYVRSKEIREYPMLIKMNDACKIDSLPFLQSIKQEKDKESRNPPTLLPRVNRLPNDFAASCQKRYSPGWDFILKQISQENLSTLLMEAASAFTYRNDLDEGFPEHPFRVSLYGSFYKVEGIPNGSFYYDSSIHALIPIQGGDFRNHLQFGLGADFVNMSQIPLAFNIAGHKDHYQKAFGYRGHRIQQMEAGILSQHLLLAASALNMGGHPILGFNVHSYDNLYKISAKGKTSLLQIPIGHLRPHPRLQGSLHN